MERVVAKKAGIKDIFKKKFYSSDPLATKHFLDFYKEILSK